MRKQTHFTFDSFLYLIWSLWASWLIWVLIKLEIHLDHTHHRFHYPKHIVRYLPHKVLMCGILLQKSKQLTCEQFLILIMAVQCLHCYHDHIILYYKKLLHLPMNKLFLVNPMQLNENHHSQCKLYFYQKAQRLI